MPSLSDHNSPFPTEHSRGPTPALFHDLFRGKRVLWQAFFGTYVVGLDRLLPVSTVTCLNDGSDFDLIRDECNIEFCSVDQVRGRRSNWVGCSINKVFERRGPAIEELLCRHPKDAWLLTSSPACPLMRTLCNDLGYRYVGTPPETVEQFKHKARLFEALDELRLPRIRGSWGRLRNRSYRGLASEFGSDIVVQQPFGAAGMGTALLRSQVDLDNLGDGYLAADVWLAPYLGALSFNINAAVIDDLVCVGYPSVQLTGLAELGAPFGGYCGNDYTSATETDPAIIDDVQQQTERAGEWLRSRGFEGGYGLDFVMNPSDGRPYAVDLNPRWQGSTALSVQAELRAGRLPLMAALFAAQCGVLGLSEIRPLQGAFRQPITGSQLNLRCRLREDSIVTTAVQPGVYELAPNLKFKRTAFRPGDLIDDEILLTGGVPRVGVVAEPGAWLCRLVSWRSALTPHSASLKPWAAKAANDLPKQFGFQPVKR